ncbi:MAG: hypothetical protein AAFY20_04465 [Cyanobacteria bacterium J06639_14]
MISESMTVDPDFLMGGPVPLSLVEPGSSIGGLVGPFPIALDFSIGGRMGRSFSVIEPNFSIDGSINASCSMRTPMMPFTATSDDAIFDATSS